MENNKGTFLYTEDQLMARLKFFIGICLALTLTGIVFVVLYSIIFVTQPLNAISPIDQKFFELIIPIATFLTGTLSGIMLAGNDREAQKMAMQAANKGWERPPTPITNNNPAPVVGTMGVGPIRNGLNGINSNDFRHIEPSFSDAVATGFGGKPAPIQPPHPEI